MTTPAPPPPAALAVSSAFVRALVDPRLRAHIARIGARDCPIVGTAADETVGSLLDRLSRAAQAAAVDRVLVVTADGTQRFGLQIWLVRTPLR